MSEEAKNETPFYDPDPITMPVLALRGLVVYPKMMVHFDVGREASVKAVEEAMSTNSPVFLVAQKDIRVEEPEKNYFLIPGSQRYTCRTAQVEGDWSNAAFFLCAGAVSWRGVTVEGLSLRSSQGDQAVLRLLRRFGAEVTEREGAVTVRGGMLHGITVDAGPIPDLIPTLSVVAAAAVGDTRIENARRLRDKESDRLEGTAALIRDLGGSAQVEGDTLLIHGRGGLRGGNASVLGDHRLAMAAAIAACACRESVTVDDSRCVEKSYPRFWEDLRQLKGEEL